MWDTWLYYHDGIHYLYYLHKSAGEVWDGMSVASSTDGVHFEEIGPIIHKRDDAEWLGTGSVWRVKGKFMIKEPDAGIVYGQCQSLKEDSGAILQQGPGIKHRG